MLTALLFVLASSILFRKTHGWCVCAAVYDPYCCDGTTYGNACQARCGGITVDACNEGECAPTAKPAVIDTPTNQAAPTAKPPRAPKDCIRVQGSRNGAINGIYEVAGVSDGVAAYRNKKKKTYGGKQVKIKLYRFKSYWTFGTERGNSESITQCKKVMKANRIDGFLKCNYQWRSDAKLKISYSACNWAEIKGAAGLEMDESEAPKTTRTIVGVSVAVLIAVIVALGVCVCRYKKRNQISKERVMDEEEAEEEEEGEELTELEVVLPQTTA